MPSGTLGDQPADWYYHSLAARDQGRMQEGWAQSQQSPN